MRKTRKQHKGGRYLGSGTYGCTFGEPPLPCVNKNGRILPRRSSDQISKLMEFYEAGDAMKSNILLRKIDPAQQYFISSINTDICRAALSSLAITKEDELDKCPNYTPYHEYKLVFSQNGGTDLSKNTLTARDYAPFFKSMFNVLVGMKLAHTNQIVHLDIKPGNIVSKRLPTGEFQTRLIDFDFVCDLKTLTGRNDSTLPPFDTNYVFWPFDSRFINSEIEEKFAPTELDTNLQIQEKIEELTDSLDNWYNVFEPKKLKDPEYFKGLVVGDKKPFDTNRNAQIWARRYLNNYMPYININDSTYKGYLKKIDVYMVGFTLGLVLNRFFDYLMVCVDEAAMKYKLHVNVKSIEGVNMKKMTGKKDNYVPVDMLESIGCSKELQDWHVRVQDELMVYYMNLVDLMTTMDVSRRISMIDAVDIYRGFLHLFDELFTEDAILNYLVPLGAIKVNAQPVLEDRPSPTNLAKIQVSPASPKQNRPYQVPPTNLRKVRTNLFSGGKRGRKTYKKRSRK